MGRPSNDRIEPTAPGACGKLRYEKPAFRHERVFETLALACGKVQGTQSSCVSSRKSS